MLGKLMNTYHIYTARMSPAFNGSSALEHFERSNEIEIHNGIMFDFYPGLPHVCAMYWFGFEYNSTVLWHKDLRTTYNIVETYLSLNSLPFLLYELHTPTYVYVNIL